MADDKPTNGTKPFWKFTAVATAIVVGVAALNTLGSGVQKVAERLSVPARLTALEKTVGDMGGDVKQILVILKDKKVGE